MSLPDMFANRVKKNARHLGKWAKREAVTCWRVYDRDIPELPVTLDTYDGALVLNDYRIDPSDDVWLDELAAVGKAALDATDIFVKRRERLTDRQDGHQYERLAATNQFRVVKEAGLAFRVNLGDYVDTGLFLDHRLTRARVAAEPAKSLLNLFAYTGAFSVHAAAAGMATTSVDLSNTYTEWARTNLDLNNLTGEVIAADVKEFLVDARRAGRHWDVAIVDPPTFSNSKRMQGTMVVERDHSTLIEQAGRILAPGGTLIFSCNAHGFKLAPESLPNWSLQPLSAETLPLDFARRPQRHHCWALTRP